MSTRCSALQNICMNINKGCRRRRVGLGKKPFQECSGANFLWHLSDIQKLAMFQSSLQGTFAGGGGVLLPHALLRGGGV